MLKIGVILGSTRETRFANKPAKWFMELAKQREDMTFELLDLRDYKLPFFNEVASNIAAPTQNEKACVGRKRSRNLTAT